MSTVTIYVQQMRKVRLVRACVRHNNCNRQVSCWHVSSKTFDISANVKFEMDCSMVFVLLMLIVDDAIALGMEHKG